MLNLKKFVGFKTIFSIFVLNTAASTAEAIGIAMVIPLLASMDVEFDSGTTQSGAVAWLMAQVSDYSALAIIILISGFFVFKAIVTFIAKVNVVKTRANLSVSLKQSLLNKYDGMRYAYFTEKHPGYFINILNKQTAGLMSSIVSSIDFISKITLGLIYVIFAFGIAPEFALMAACFGLIIFLFFKGINSRLRDTSRVAASEGSNLAKLVIQSIQSFKYLKATGQAKKPQTKILDSLNILNRMAIKSGTFSNIAGVLKEPLSIFVISGIFYYQTQIVHQPIGPIIVAIILFHRGVSVMFGIQQSWQAMLSTIGSAELFSAELERQQCQSEPNGSIILDAELREIDFNGLCFGYEGTAEYQLQDLNFKLVKGMHVALVGLSGSGKSTLLDLITLLHGPSCGKLLINGIDASQIDKSSWRSKVGCVIQDAVIFNDSILNNITMWTDEDDVDRDALTKAVADSGLNEVIQNLPLGLHTQMGDRGSKFSGGQKQRVAIARELYRNPELLILDEASSALDNSAEAHLKKTINRLRANMIVVTVAHRFSVIENADLVLVLKDGKLVENGSFNDLVEQKGSVFNLLRSQH